MGRFGLPSAGNIIRGAFLTMISLIVLRTIGAAVPALQSAPLVGAAFR